jgi:tetratricopeptide (TPR) repeat protein
MNSVWRKNMRFLFLLILALAAASSLLISGNAHNDGLLTQTQPVIRYNFEYKCGGETIVIGHCRKDSDMAGYPPTQPADDYCQVYYPDRPKRGGFTAMGTELRGDIIKQLQTCGAFAPTQTSNPTGGNVEAVVDQGNKYYGAKDYKNALAAYQKVIALRPDTNTLVRVNTSLGLTYIQLTQFEKAVLSFKEALRLKPDHENALGGLGTAYLGLQQYQNAVAALQLALRVKPDDSDDYHILGLAYQGLKEYPSAAAAFQQAIRLNPDLAVSYVRLGQVYSAMGRKNDGLQVYKKLLTIDKVKAQELYDYINSPAAATTQPGAAAGSAAAYIVEGDKYRQAKDYAKAVEAYKKAIALKPGIETSAKTYTLIGAVYYSQRQYEEAVAAFQEALRLKPADDNVAFGLGQTYLHLDAPVQASHAFRQAARLKPASAEYQYWVGFSDSLLYPPDYPDAVRAFQQAIRLKPGYTDAYYWLGITYHDMGKKDEALKVYKTLLTIDKGRAEKFYAEINKGN